MEIAFLIGLLSSLHCLGMCGGIAGALSMSLAAEKRNNFRSLFLYSSAYNIGRILSYMLAGSIVGLLGQSFINLTADIGFILLRSLLMIFVILLGLYVGGWLPHLAIIEKLGTPIWAKLQPIGLKFLPVKNLAQAFIFGFIWGWLPCGLVYYALLISFAQGSMIDSALFMFTFGMGTFLPMLYTGIFAGKLSSSLRSNTFKTFSSLLLIIMGMIGLLVTLYPNVRHKLHYFISQ